MALWILYQGLCNIYLHVINVIKTYNFKQGTDNFKSSTENDGMIKMQIQTEI